MNETHSQIIETLKDGIEKIGSILDATKPQTETEDLTEDIVQRATDKIMEDVEQIKDDIIDKACDSIDISESEISDLVFERLDLDDISEELAGKLSETIVEEDSPQFYKKLAKHLLEAIRDEKLVSS